MKRTITNILIATVTVITVSFQTVYADEPDYSDTDYWNNLCTSRNLNEEEQEACEAYSEYLKSSLGTLNQQLEELKNQQDEIRNNLAAYAMKIDEYQAKIDAEQVEINNLTVQIQAKEDKLNALYAQLTLDQSKTFPLLFRRVVGTVSKLVGNNTIGSDQIYDFTDTGFWESACASGQLNDTQKKACAAYESYKGENLPLLLTEEEQKKITDLKEQIENSKTVLEEKQNSLFLMQEEIKLVRSLLKTED